MKSLLFIFLMLVVGGATSFAQCGKKVLLTASKTTYLDSNGTVQRTVDEKSVIHISQSGMTIHVNDEQKMSFVIKNITCNWKDPYKEGKTFIVTTFNKDQEEAKNATMDIEGKDGKIILLFKVEGRPVVIKVVIDKFEEEG